MYRNYWSITTLSSPEGGGGTAIYGLYIGMCHCEG